MKIPLGILEFGFIKPPRLHAHEVINAIFSEIGIYEELGYSRFWLSEHYSSEFAWFSPETLLPLLAGYSNSIKIGWAGVLLRYHNPLTLANNFKILSSIFDGRIDVGIAPATIAEKYRLHLDDGKPWQNKMLTFLSFLRNDKDENLNTQLITIPPHATDIPSPWYLSTSSRSLELAADAKMNFALSFMHPGSNYSANIDTIKKYKEIYYKKHAELPRTVVLVSCVHTLSTLKIRLLEKRYSIEGFSNIFGDKDYIHENLYKIQEVMQNDEFILYSPECDRQARVDSFSNILSSHT